MFVCPKDGDKLTLSLNTPEVVTSQLIEVDTPAPAPKSNSSLITSPPISVTHFSQNGLAGLQRETLFSDTMVPTNLLPVTTIASINPFINNFANSTSGPTAPTTTSSDVAPASHFGASLKFATIGRSNLFSSSPLKNKNPFLEPAPPAPASLMSTTGYSSPMSSPEASLKPSVETADSRGAKLSPQTSDNGAGGGKFALQSSLRKIVSCHTCLFHYNCKVKFII